MNNDKGLAGSADEGLTDSESAEGSKFAQADRISDRIVDILNDERKKPGFNLVQAFAGQLLAILAFSNTAPTPRPRPMAHVCKAAGECLMSIMADPSAALSDQHDPTAAEPANKKS